MSATTPSEYSLLRLKESLYFGTMSHTPFWFKPHTKHLSLLRTFHPPSAPLDLGLSDFSFGRFGLSYLQSGVDVVHSVAWIARVLHLFLLKLLRPSILALAFVLLRMEDAQIHRAVACSFLRTSALRFHSLTRCTYNLIMFWFYSLWLLLVSWS